MSSTTSGTTSFTMDVDEILETARDLVGGEYVSAVDVAKDRRDLNLVLIELQNQNIPLNKLETVDNLATVVDQDFITLDGSITDIMELSIIEPSEDFELPVTRKDLKFFQRIPNKTQSERPTLWVTDRQEDAVTVKFWPVPDKVYTVTALVAKRIEDITASYQKIDISYRYYPLLIQMLAYRIATRLPGVPMEKKQELKMDLREMQPSTFEEDRERVDMMKALIVGSTCTPYAHGCYEFDLFCDNKYP